MDKQPQATISDILPGFIEYMSVERRFSRSTIAKYRANVGWFVRDVGNLAIRDIRLEHFVALKSRMDARGAREARMASLIFAMKSLLVYARDVLGIQVVDIRKIRARRSPRREVMYLSSDEIQQFVAAIPLQALWTQQPRVSGYCFRALVEMLLTSGMRISEALGLDRSSVDYAKREAVIIGKGNKQRTVFFTEVALEWLRQYLALRKDSNPALFVTGTGRRLQVSQAEAMCRRISRRAQLEKHVTPHMLRHTAATRLLQNGCPIGFIKEVLGHERLETTCRFYLGVLDKADTKKAFQTYMRYDNDRTSHATGQGSGGELPIATSSATATLGT
jgi:integrase/recombinase XerD